MSSNATLLDSPHIDRSIFRHLKIRAMTHKGNARPSNQDRIAVNAWSTSDTLENAFTFEEATRSRVCCLVADGMGGRNAGELASELAVKFILDRIQELITLEAIGTALIDTNRLLHSAMTPETVGMGATIAGLVFHGTEAIHFNIGDSRIYLWRDGELNLISTDDTLSAHLGGPKTSSRITQVLGGSSPDRVLQPHVGKVRLEAGTKFLICSDGVSDLIDDDEMGEILTSSGSQDTDALVSLALHRGGRDNASALTIEVV